MTVVILNPKKVIIAGLLCTLLFAGSIMGVMALAGLLRSKPAQAYGGQAQVPKNGTSLKAIPGRASRNGFLFITLRVELPEEVEMQFLHK